MRPISSLSLAILGSGPAGAAAAYHLACAGFNVTLIERAPFPRPKVCGEYISPAATALLESILPAHALLSAGAQRIDTFTLHLGHRIASWRAPAPAWSLARETLDTLLQRKALASGAQLLTASVRSAAYHDTHATLTLSTGETLTFDVLIHADGKGAHDPARPTPLAPNLIAHKCHLRIPAFNDAAVSMRICPGAYIGAIAIAPNHHTCALVCTRGLTRRYPNTDDLLTQLWPDYRARWRTGTWHACGVPRSRYIAPGHPRSFRIGNAAAAVDPIGGEGIGLALWSAATLAHCLRTLPDLPAAHRTLARAYSHRLRTRLPACRIAAAVLTRPDLARALWPLTHLPALTFAPFYRLTGKPLA
jgi:2-polyprenyl-6-methoxyphenol hydroxylase-like FAD-dependent oxidoreductase